MQIISPYISLTAKRQSQNEWIVLNRENIHENRIEKLRG